MNRYQIEAPVRSFTGESVGVTFHKGTGYVTDEDKAGRAALEYFRRHGYGVSPAPEKTLEEAVQELVTGTPPQREPLDPNAPYNPGDHKAEEVLEYLNGADLTEALRVLDAEADGKGRVTITKHRDEVLAAKTAPADEQKGAGA